MTIKCNPNSQLYRSRQGLAPAPGEPELVLTYHRALSRLQSFLTDARKAPKSILQIRWERRWTAAPGQARTDPASPRFGDRRSRGRHTKKIKLSSFEQSSSLIALNLAFPYARWPELDLEPN